MSWITTPDLPRKSLEALIEVVLDRWADWFTSNFQATLNSKSLTCLILGNDKPEGLARIFETINSTGLNLSVFDLDARKPDFGHAGQIAPRFATTNSLRSPHTEKLAFLPNPLAFSS
jgi:hypothetical protein